MSEQEFDVLVPDSKVWREFGVCSLTLARWSKDPELGFPPAIKIQSGQRGRFYRSRKALEAFKEKLLRQSLERMAAE